MIRDCNIFVDAFRIDNEIQKRVAIVDEFNGLKGIQKSLF